MHSTIRVLFLINPFWMSHLERRSLHNRSDDIAFVTNNVIYSWSSLQNKHQRLVVRAASPRPRDQLRTCTIVNQNGQTPDRSLSTECIARTCIC
jgi:hypothetical protein